MSLQTSIESYVNGAIPAAHVTIRQQTAQTLRDSGNVYLDSGSVLCVRADAVASSQVGASTLPTRISGAANTILTSLRELANAGLLDRRVLHDLDPGVVVQA